MRWLQDCINVYTESRCNYFALLVPYRMLTNVTKQQTVIRVFRLGLTFFEAAAAQRPLQATSERLRVHCSMAQSPSRMQPKRKTNHKQQPTFITSSSLERWLPVDDRLLVLMEQGAYSQTFINAVDCLYTSMSLACADEWLRQLPRLNCFAR